MKFNKLLEKYPQYQKLINQALEERVLLFNPQAPEKCDEQDVEGYNIPLREGLSSEDINGYITPSLKDYFQGNWENYLEGYNVYCEYLKTPKNFLDKVHNQMVKIKAVFKAFNFVSFTTPWTHWIWVVDSLDSIAHDLVMKNMKKGTSYSMEEYKEKVKAITHEEKVEFVNKNYYQISPHMWVTENDPGVIIYDNLHKPYDLKDGWSYTQIGEILSEWVFEMTGEEITADYVEYQSWE